MASRQTQRKKRGSTDAPSTWEERKVLSRKNTAGTSCNRSISSLMHCGYREYSQYFKVLYRGYCLNSSMHFGVRCYCCAYSLCIQVFGVLYCLLWVLEACTRRISSDGTARTVRVLAARKYSQHAQHTRKYQVACIPVPYATVYVNIPLDQFSKLDISTPLGIVPPVLKRPALEPSRQELSGGVSFGM